MTEAKMSIMCTDDGVPISTEQEVALLIEEMSITISEVENSDLYLKMVDQLQNDTTVKSNIERVLGSDQHFQLVIYALGSIQFSYASQHQLALPILLKRDFPRMINDIETYDPCYTEADVMVLEALGCKVLSVNENCRRRVEKPTLFYMMNTVDDCIENLLEANWSHSHLNHMILLTNFFALTGGKPTQYVHSIFSHIIDIEIDSYKDLKYPFRGLDWNFFNLGLNIDMEALLAETRITMENHDESEFNQDEVLDEFEEENEPSEFKQDEEESHTTKFMRHNKTVASLPFEGYEDQYEDLRDDWGGYIYDLRFPNIVHRRWCAPYTGWVKLNFSGKSLDSVDIASHGGIFHNEYKECLASYAGRLGNVDSAVAKVEGLKLGLRCLQEYFPHVKKLVIEGDDSRIVQWTNRLVESPKRLNASFHEIHKVLDTLECVVLNVNKEANAKAIQLADKGVKFPYPRVCLFGYHDNENKHKQSSKIIYTTHFTLFP